MKLSKQILLMIGLSSCASAQFVPAMTTQSYPSRTAPEQIETYRTQPPQKKFKEIGAVNACCSRDVNSLVDMMRKKASENGGDALLGIDPYGAGSVAASVIRYE